ncbi:MAG: polysaccharide deacetylase family protein [Bryobacteraceae bacterium]|jgi:polysaccharide deacetylase family protein (PEP-CTERM system associated)
MRPHRPLSNFLTVDVEEYFHVNYEGIDPGSYASRKTNLPALVDRLLSVFDDASIRCTFFVLGVIGEKYPELVRNIHARGHEVASHGYDHKAVREMSGAEFRDDLLKSRGILESIVGRKIQGFRAPSFSVDRETLPMFYRALQECGYGYSSSVFPGKTFLYGVPGAPFHPHRPAFGGVPSGVIEFPITRFELFGKRFPVYVRLFPASALQRRILRENRQGRPAMIYVHPREIDPGQPRLPLSRGRALIHYWGIRGCEAKLRRLLARGALEFTSIRDYLADGAFERTEVVAGDEPAG